jgi:hypothetical protein
MGCEFTECIWIALELGKRFDDVIDAGMPSPKDTLVEINLFDMGSPFGHRQRPATGVELGYVLYGHRSPR